MHETLIQQIRNAFEPGAPAETRGAAALACRTLLGVLEPAIGQPADVPRAGASTSTATPGSPPPAGSPGVQAVNALVDALFEKFKPHLEATAVGGLFPEPARIPFVTIPTYRR